MFHKKMARELSESVAEVVAEAKFGSAQPIDLEELVRLTWAEFRRLTDRDKARQSGH